MTMPTADQVAWAIVTASELCGDDPVEVLTRKGNSQARAYAFQALKRVFKLGNVDVARLLGCQGNDATRVYLREAHRAHWFDWSIFRDVVRAVDPTFDQSEIPFAKHAYLPRLALADHDSLTARLMGDPLPGRSALDQRRAAA